MSLIDWLQKLGILRFGAEGAVYHNAKERPASLQMDGVFNSKKDVVDFDKRGGQEADSSNAAPTDTR